MASGSTNGGRTSIVTVVPITGSTRSIRSGAPPVTGVSVSPAVPPDPLNLGRAQPLKPAASSAACSDLAYAELVNVAPETPSMFALWADSAWLLRIGSTSFEIAPERPPDGQLRARSRR